MLRRLILVAIICATLLVSGCLCGFRPKPVPPEITSDGMGGAITAWHSNSDLHAQRVDSEGNLLWGQGGIRIRSAATRPSNPLIAGDSAGGAIVAWTGRHGETEPRWSIFAQRLDSQGNAVWAEGGIQVSTGPAEVAQSLIDLASDSSGGAILLWYKEWKIDERWETTVHAQRVGPNGICLWGEQGILVYDTAPDPRWAKLVSDGSGGAVIVWEDNRGPNTDIYAQRISSDGNTLWPDNGIPVVVAGGAQLNPQIIDDGMGNFILACLDSGGSQYNIGKNQVFVQKIDAKGKLMWATGGIPVCPVSGDQENQTDSRLTSDGSGGCIVVWHDTRSRPNRDVYAQRVSSEGKILWEADGVLIWDVSGVDKSSIEAGSYDIKIIDDGTGAIVVWQANPKSATVGAFKGGRIYAQRLSPTSERLWPEAVKVYENPSLKSQAYSSVVSDSAGGVIIGSIVGKGDWPDLVYAQRIDSDGNRLWGEEGIRLDR